MLAKRCFIMLGVVLVGALATIACAPIIESDRGAVSSSSETEISSNQAQGEGEGVVVNTPPLSETELAVQPPGQSEPGAGSASGGAPEQPKTQGGQPGAKAVYADSTYKFGVDYPADFVFRTQSADRLAQLTPTPVAAFIFMNPVTASSDLADLEPADLDLRVYSVEQSTSLESWLTSNGLLSADGTVPLQPFQKAKVSGVQVCASTMIAPGCSYFFLGAGRVYQLTPATLEGESMIETFILIP